MIPGFFCGLFVGFLLGFLLCAIMAWPEEEAEATRLVVREGCYYVRRDGNVVGPAHRFETAPHRWIVGNGLYDVNGIFSRDMKLTPGPFEADLDREFDPRMEYVK